MIARLSDRELREACRRLSRAVKLNQLLDNLVDDAITRDSTPRSRRRYRLALWVLNMRVPLWVTERTNVALRSRLSVVPTNQ
jgi:hypothetical protein